MDIKTYELIPKLPNQDEYLLYLQNTKYSDLTVYNYARDLSIFALFLKVHGISFDSVTKQQIIIYIGRLNKGEHLEDLKKYRMEVQGRYKSHENGTEGYKGPNSNSDDQGGISGGPDEPAQYLDSVYRKVFGSLGEFVSKDTGRDHVGLDARSVNRMLSALRSFLKYRIEYDLSVPIPPDAIKLVKAERKIAQVAEFDDLVRLIECPSQFEHSSEVAVRNRTMLEILFSTGMRISELMSLNLDMINLDGKFYIVGKGKKGRFVYMTPRAMNWINKYLEIRLRYTTDSDDEKNKEVMKINEKLIPDRETYRVTLDNIQKNSDVDDDDRKYINMVVKLRENQFLEKFDSPALFIPFSGGRDGHRRNRLSTNYFQEKIAEYRRRLGIAVPTSAHSLRHGFATYLAEENASPAAIQKLLGHASLNTTSKYVHASDKFAEETHRDKHPLS